MSSPLFVSRFGSGAPMLALHGIEAHGVRYVGLASFLPEFQIVAPDLRGHGRSPRTGPYTLEQHVADILPLLEELGPATTLLGHSYGGLIAWEVARAAANKITRLVLVDPPIQVDPQFARDSVATSPVHLRWLTRSEAFDEMVAGRRHSAHWSVSLDVAVGLEAGGTGRLKVAVEEEIVRACWLDQLPQPLSESTWRGPTLLVEAGLENGAFLTPQALSDFRRQLGDALTHVVVDLPHTITADGPELLATHIRKFVA